MVRSKKLNAAILAIIGSFSVSSCGKNIIKTNTAVTQERFLSQKGLPAQNLKSGSCALFLWGAGNGRPLQFYQDAAQSQATFAIDPDLPAERISADGRILEGFYTEQTFVQRDLKIEVKLRAGDSRNVLKGIPIPYGRMVITERDGQATIIPVSGLFGCRK